MICDVFARSLHRLELYTRPLHVHEPRSSQVRHDTCMYGTLVCTLWFHRAQQQWVARGGTGTGVLDLKFSRPCTDWIVLCTGPLSRGCCNTSQQGMDVIYIICGMVGVAGRSCAESSSMHVSWVRSCSLHSGVAAAATLTGNRFPQ